MLNAVQLPKQTSGRCTITVAHYWTLYNSGSKLLSAVQLPEQTNERCTITEVNYWALYNYLNKLLSAVQLPKKLLDDAQLPKTSERCTLP